MNELCFIFVLFQASTFSPVNAVNTNILLWLEPSSLLRAATAPSFEKETIAAEAFVPDSETAKSVSKAEASKESAGAVPAQLPESVETLVVADALGTLFCSAQNVLVIC